VLRGIIDARPSRAIRGQPSPLNGGTMVRRGSPVREARSARAIADSVIR